MATFNLHVLDRVFPIDGTVAAPLIALDILYWDDGESEDTDPHLHLNPEMHGFPAMEDAVYEKGIGQLPTVEQARAIVRANPRAHYVA